MFNFVSQIPLDLLLITARLLNSIFHIIHPINSILLLFSYIDYPFRVQFYIRKDTPFDFTFCTQRQTALLLYNFLKVSFFRFLPYIKSERRCYTWQQMHLAVNSRMKWQYKFCIKIIPNIQGFEIGTCIVGIFNL
jgi:hypothetical protein